jgi:hypothetical protein
MLGGCVDSLTRAAINEAATHATLTAREFVLQRISHLHAERATGGERTLVLKDR